MILCSVEPKGQIFVKGYRFLPFAKRMSKCIGRNMTENLTCK